MGKKGKYVAFREENEIIELVDHVVADKGIDRSGDGDYPRDYHQRCALQIVKKRLDVPPRV